MALGSNFQRQDNNQKTYDPSYYSRLRIKNYKEENALAFTFWKGTLKVAIVNEKEDLAYIHLSPTKARLLSTGVHRVLDNPETNDIYAVDTGIGDTRGFIAVGRDMGVPYLFIGKVNSDGSYESNSRFNFNTDFNYLLKVHDLLHLEYQKEYDNQVELLEFAQLLDDYARSVSGAFGASVYDIGRYENAKTVTLIKGIAEKSGVATNYSKNNNTGHSFFSNNDYSKPSQKDSNNNGRKSYQSIDDLESELG